MHIAGPGAGGSRQRGWRLHGSHHLAGTRPTPSAPRQPAARSHPFRPIPAPPLPRHPCPTPPTAPVTPPLVLSPRSPPRAAAPIAPSAASRTPPPRNPPHPAAAAGLHLPLLPGRHAVHLPRPGRQRAGLGPAVGPRHHRHQRPVSGRPAGARVAGWGRGGAQGRACRLGPVPWPGSAACKLARMLLHTAPAALPADPPPAPPAVRRLPPTCRPPRPTILSVLQDGDNLVVELQAQGASGECPQSRLHARVCGARHPACCWPPSGHAARPGARPGARAHHWPCAPPSPRAQAPRACGCRAWARRPPTSTSPAPPRIWEGARCAWAAGGTCAGRAPR